MAITRSIENISRITDWTDEVNRIPNQYGWVKEQGIFEVKPTSQTAIIFDKNTATTTLLPQVPRGSRETTVGKDRKVETFSLPLAYFKHSDYITPADIQGQRMSGTPDSPETLANARAEKLEGLRRTVDQTQEYMQVQALKGISTTPDGTVLANMFTEFGVAQPTINFALGTSGTNVDGKIAELKRGVQSKLLSGGSIQGVDVMCGESFFDDLIDHAKVREAYMNSQSNEKYQRDISKYMPWGVSDVFVHRGVRFFTYPAVFLMPDGTTEKAVEDNEAHVIPRVRGLFRGYVGPNNKLSGANQGGREMFVHEYTDPRDEHHEMQIETAPLYFSTNAAVLYKLTNT